MTPGWKVIPSRPPPSSASTASMMGWDSSEAMCPAEKSTMVPALSTVTRLQRKATSPGLMSTPMAAASIGARPVW
jgi:hypothetical protein